MKANSLPNLSVPKTLDSWVNGMRQAEVCAELGIGRGTINHRKASIRQRYYRLYGEI